MTAVADTRTLIMDRAAQLLMSRGFNGFSYRDISTHLGVKNAAIHYHFPTKADLALALVNEYRETLRKETSGFMAHGGPALPQLDGFFAFTAQQCAAGRCICPFGAFSVDYTDVPESVRKATAGFLDDTLSWLTKVLETGRRQQEFSFNGDAGSKALSILAALQGVRQLARIDGPEMLHQVIAQIRQELGVQPQH